MVDHSIGKIYMKTQAYENALAFFQHGLHSAERAQGFSHLSHISKSLSQLYFELGNSDSAYFYLNMNKVYEDSLKLRSTTEKLLREELVADFNREKIQLLQIYEKNKNYVYLSMVVLICGLLYLYVKSYLRKNRLQRIEGEKLNLEQIAARYKVETLEMKDKVEQTQKELTLISMQSIQKDQFLQSLSASINKEGKQGEKSDKSDLDKLLTDIKVGKNQISLSHFEFRFSNIYIGFFEKLNHDYPNLSQNERRISAFLKLQLTTKEISAITGQSVRAIEIGRTRLRKKLGLTNSDINLYDFFLDY